MWFLLHGCSELEPVTQPASITGGANIHIFVLTDLKSNRFQKKLMMQNTIYEYSPLQLSTLSTPLSRTLNHLFILALLKQSF